MTSIIIAVYVFFFSFFWIPKVKYDSLIITELQSSDAPKCIVATQCLGIETNEEQNALLMNLPPPLNSQEIIW